MFSIARRLGDNDLVFPVSIAEHIHIVRCVGPQRVVVDARAIGSHDRVIEPGPVRPPRNIEIHRRRQLIRQILSSIYVKYSNLKLVCTTFPD